MKLILSRKGFDSGSGKMASPILPDGTMIPLPIPSNRDTSTLLGLNFPGIDIEAIVSDLSGGTLPYKTFHLDPDLVLRSIKRFT